jgi:hypothetical protein
VFKIQGGVEMLIIGSLISASRGSGENVRKIIELSQHCPKVSA